MKAEKLPAGGLLIFLAIACGGLCNCARGDEKSSRLPVAPTASPAVVRPGATATPLSIGGDSNTRAENGPAESGFRDSDSAAADGNADASRTAVENDGGLRREVTSIKGEVSDVEGAIEGLGARTSGNEIVVELPSDVLFDFDKYDIRPDAAAALEKVLTIIDAQAADGAVRIEGHSDSVATDAYNQTLSERRAAAVQAWFAARGVSISRMRTRGFGESRPKVRNTEPGGADDPEGRRKNRRVEIFIRKK